MTSNIKMKDDLITISSCISVRMAADLLFLSLQWLKRYSSSCPIVWDNTDINQVLKSNKYAWYLSFPLLQSSFLGFSSSFLFSPPTFPVSSRYSPISPSEAPFQRIRHQSFPSLFSYGCWLTTGHRRNCSALL